MEGPPILFVHGALGDARTWGPVLDALPWNVDARAITLSFFGTAAWSGDGSAFGTERHTQDLEQFIDATMDAPVVVVAWSYSCHPALLLAKRRPDLVAALVLYEPAFASFIEDEGLRAEFGADAAACFGPVGEALAQGGEEAAAHALFDQVGKRGFIADMAPERRRLALDNARMMPLLMGKGAPPVKISADEVRALDIPVIAAMGAETRPAFAIPTRALAGLAPRGRLEVVEGAGHLLPESDPARFAGLVSDWLAHAELDAQ
ncbi:alpha/beta fold hydrolase [Croceicoccus sp. Ery5]|uniref:alpha/beta fold hydrolase n=1 Tax=Croceicoccus sp. Ery5 TaxID=1703340 RepID=UPI001E3895E3|nr:alpha/beta hydrolase [Croceicoccus sp. Ery5]